MAFRTPPRLEDRLEPLEYRVGDATLRIAYRGLEAIDADVLVSSDDVDLSMGGGVSLALLSEGGHTIFQEAQAHAPIPLGDLLVTGAGRLKARYIFHAAVLDYSRLEPPTIDLIRAVTRKCLAHCEALGLTSIAFPALATGVAGLSPERSAMAMLIEIASFLERSTHVRRVTIALHLVRARLEVVTRFHAKASAVLELICSVRGTSAVLASLERAYREAGEQEDAQRSAFAFSELDTRRAIFEEALSSAEPEDLARTHEVDLPLAALENAVGRDVVRAHRGDPDATRGSLKPAIPRDWSQLERRYKEERRGALRALLALREKNLTELELEEALSGATTELSKQIESIQTRRNWLADQLQKLEAELLGQPAPATAARAPTASPSGGGPRPPAARAARVLHLSDIHFGTARDAELWYGQLAEDLVEELDCSALDAVVLSGDISNRSAAPEYDAAKLFLDKLCQRFNVDPRALVIVPGNHDVDWDLSERAYRPVKRKHYSGAPDSEAIIANGDFIEVREDEKYHERMAPFAAFYKAVKGDEYPLDPAQQATLHHLPEHKLLVLGLNSAWKIDHHYTARADIHPLAVNHALNRIAEAGDAYRDCVKLAVWHHPLHSGSEDRMKDHGVLERLAKTRFRVVLHGHIHKADSAVYRYDHSTGGRSLGVVASGTFGAPVREWVPGHPLQYNLLRIEADRMIVETRRREELNGAWKPDARWTQGPGTDPLPRYAIQL